MGATKQTTTFSTTQMNGTLTDAVYTPHRLLHALRHRCQHRHA